MSIQSKEAALKQLPARQREIIQLRFYKSLNWKEIGKATGIQYQSLANQMYRAVQTLRDLHVLKSQELQVNSITE